MCVCAFEAVLDRDEFISFKSTTLNIDAIVNKSFRLPLALEMQVQFSNLYQLKLIERRGY